jgi:class 3 adenylate cyclase
MERKLAAILAADVAGNSRLMERDEESTLDALRSHREVVHGLLATRRRCVVNRVGKATNRVTEIPQRISERNDSVRACGSSSASVLGSRDFAGRGRRL